MRVTSQRTPSMSMKLDYAVGEEIPEYSYTEKHWKNYAKIQGVK
jgi:hypothetical protein